MKLFSKIVILCFTFFIATSCAKVYYSTDSFALARVHKRIAIVPPTVSIAARKKDNADAIREQQKTESVNFQKEMYSWLLRRKGQGKITQEILDTETTNAKLRNAGYPEKALTPKEICDILEVDGIITSNFSMSKPMSEGAAVAIGLLVGFWGATNDVNVTMSIHDGKGEKMIWNYEHKYSGGVGSTPARLVDGLMRNASKKMPYIRQ